MKLKRLASLAAVAVAALAAPDARAQTCAVSPTCADVIFSVDVPSKLTGNHNVRAYQVTRCTDPDGAPPAGYANPLYFSGTGLSTAVNVVSIAARHGRNFLFTTDAPFTVAAVTYQTTDIVEATNVGTEASPNWTYLLYDSLGDDLASSVVLDSLAFRPGTGELLMSFDVPVTIGATTYQPSDIVKYVAPDTYSLHVSAVTLGIPTGSNVVGYDELEGNDRYVMFDVPTTIGASSYRGGWVWRRSPGGWDTSPFYCDSLFPTGNIGTDFSFMGSPGKIGDDALRVNKSGSNLTLDWSTGVSCEANPTMMYEIYEGTIGSWSGHVKATKSSPVGEACTTTANTETITPLAGNKYYLVVARNGGVEGSYGQTSAGAQRPRAATPCVTMQKTLTCP